MPKSNTKKMKRASYSRKQIYNTLKQCSRLIKENPNISISALADLVGKNYKTLYTWIRKEIKTEEKKAINQRDKCLSGLLAWNKKEVRPIKNIRSVYLLNKKKAICNQLVEIIDDEALSLSIDSVPKLIQMLHAQCPAMSAFKSNNFWCWVNKERKCGNNGSDEMPQALLTWANKQGISNRKHVNAKEYLDEKYTNFCKNNIDVKTNAFREWIITSCYPSGKHSILNKCLSSLEKHQNNITYDAIAGEIGTKRIILYDLIRSLVKKINEMNSHCQTYIGEVIGSGNNDNFTTWVLSFQKQIACIKKLTDKFEQRRRYTYSQKEEKLRVLKDLEKVEGFVPRSVVCEIAGASVNAVNNWKKLKLNKKPNQGSQKQVAKYSEEETRKLVQGYAGIIKKQGAKINSIPELVIEFNERNIINKEVSRATLYDSMFRLSKGTMQNKHLNDEDFKIVMKWYAENRRKYRRRTCVNQVHELSNESIELRNEDSDNEDKTSYFDNKYNDFFDSKVKYDKEELNATQVAIREWIIKSCLPGQHNNIVKDCLNIVEGYWNNVTTEITFCLVDELLEKLYEMDDHCEDYITETGSFIEFLNCMSNTSAENLEITLSELQYRLDWALSIKREIDYIKKPLSELWEDLEYTNDKKQVEDLSEESNSETILTSSSCSRSGFFGFSDDDTYSEDSMDCSIAFSVD